MVEDHESDVELMRRIREPLDERSERLGPDDAFVQQLLDALVERAEAVVVGSGVQCGGRYGGDTQNEEAGESSRGGHNASQAPQDMRQRCACCIRVGRAENLRNFL